MTNKTSKMNNKSNKQLIVSLTLNYFQNESIIINSLENTKLNSVFLSFIQLKSFFFKMPKDKKDAWKIKHNEIHSLMNLNTLFSLNLFSIYQHFNNKKMSKTIDI